MSERSTSRWKHRLANTSSLAQFPWLTGLTRKLLELHHGRAHLCQIFIFQNRHHTILGRGLHGNVSKKFSYNRLTNFANSEVSANQCWNASRNAGARSLGLEIEHQKASCPSCSWGETLGIGGFGGLGRDAQIDILLYLPFLTGLSLVADTIVFLLEILGGAWSPVPHHGAGDIAIHHHRMSRRSNIDFLDILPILRIHHPWNVGSNSWRQQVKGVLFDLFPFPLK